jgi:alpha-ketoglutarate-dependent taurine dioxygenase
MQVMTERFENSAASKVVTLRDQGAPLVTIRPLREDRSLPLVIEPKASQVDLVEWSKSNRRELERLLLECGAILFRGFTINETEQFERLIEALSGKLLDYTYRSTPRTIVSGKIYTSTEYPPHQTIPLHNENSYTRSWPMKIWFFSRTCATSGGETPIADSRRVYERIPVDVRERFERHGVMYVRNYGSGFDLPWQEVFQTDDRATVEEFCAAAGIQYEWLSDDHLRTRQVCQAVATHPITGESVWFNQAHLFHVSRLHAEVREAMLTIFSEADLPRNVYFGDGSAIPSEDLDLICAAYEHEKAVFPWQAGDVLLLDNMLAAHARNPFKGKRQVVVGMAEQFEETAPK